MKKFCFEAVLALLLCVGGSITSFAQHRVQGSVTDTDGEPLIGVSVMIEGTVTGVATDLDGHYVIDVPGPDTILEFNYIGAQAQSVAVGSRTLIDIVMKSDLQLNDVVVIGYGTQKKAVVSAAISTVGSEMLDKVSAVRVDDALKGLTPGVNVTSASGQPGAGSKISIRGLGSINDTNPIYVVDGMPVDNIDYLAPSDIERLDILKDAASCAVYGTRGANGVILVTTKKGSKDKVSVSYDFQYGLSNPWRKREVLNATEYAVLMNEAAINDGNAPVYADPYSFGKGTDWQSELFNRNAPQQSHQLSISGTSGKNQYFVSASWYSQEGIIGGNYDRSNYDRFTVRVNDRYSIFDNTKDRTWLNKMGISVNASYSRTFTKGISTNSEFGSPLGSAITLSPILGVYVDPADEQAVIDMYSKNPPAHEVDPDTGELVNPNWSDFNLLRDKNGRLFTIPGAAYNEMVNPLADLSLPGDKNNYDRLVAGGELEFQIYDGLTFRSSVNVDLSFGGTDGWTPNYYLNSNRSQGYSSVHGTMNRGFVWQVENVLTYHKVFAEKHNLTVMAGQTAYASSGRSISASRMYLTEEDPSKANLNFATSTRKDNDGSGYLYADYRLSSLFARVSYDFGNRYMVQATVRRDGSSRFGANNRFAIFPSASVAWNIKNEPFMEGRAQWLSNLKLRASWGQNGNDRSLGDFAFAALTSSGNNYVLGSGATSSEEIINGVKTQITPNPNLKWEKSNQTDVGLDFGFFGNSLQFTADWFRKVTEGMLIQKPVPSYLGEAKPWGNAGRMSNTGVELDVNYRYTIGDFHLMVGANATWMKNTLISAGNESGILDRASFSTAGVIIRGENGMPFPYFYGYQTDGIFQNWDEVRSYTYTDENGNTKMIQPNAVPGDVRFKDNNGNGEIDADDRRMLGKCTPDWTYGFNASIDWKGLDFSMVWQGVAGNSVFDGTRRTDISSANQPKWMLGRWTGEGSTDKLPRFTVTDPNLNWRVSDLYIKDASYVRLKNITLGYTLPSKWTNKIFVKKLRFYVAAENLLTLTKYDGFDPEIADYVDRGIYPQARTFQFGANITF
jgi:TonB-linked SusC/RagA family outer membrane protein